MEQEIVNRVAKSKLVTFNLEDHYHHGKRVAFDIKDWLFRELILKEKPFREQVKNHDWSQYQDANVALFCSADAIIPVWAYMLIAIQLEPFAHMISMGSMEKLETALFQRALSTIDIRDYADAKVVIKGCGRLPVPDDAYVQISALLRPVVSSIMYGEPCSTVPLYKATKRT